MPLYAEIISIGDEILYGQTLDTNSHWISGQLDEIGIKVRQKSTIGDVAEDILEALRLAESRCDIILITGGLGPTRDDLTKPLLAQYFNSPLVLHEEALADVESIFARAGRTLSELNRQQAELPAACVKVTNSLGTAPGMWFDKEGKVFVSMPGVPYEMRQMMLDTILPRLQQQFIGHVIYHKMVKTIGIPESTLAERIADWEHALPAHLKLAYLPSLGQVKLRLTAIGNSKTQLEAEVKAQIDQLIPRIAKYVYGYDGDEIEELVGKMLLEHGQTIAFAESCTGGYLSHLITAVPGSSRYFKGTVVSYDYDVKVNSLDVDAKVMEEKGAVSEEVVRMMAENVRKKLNADVGMSISGIAGPGGGLEDKPVGTVWIAYSDRHQTVAKRFTFSKDRKLNIQLSALSALNLFRINFQGN